MNMDELQAVWQAHDRQIAGLKLFNEKLVKEVAGAGSRSTIRIMERQYLKLTILFALYTVCFAAGMAGNVFDYTTYMGYLPLALQTMTSLAFLVLVASAWYRISKVSPAGTDLAGSLRLVIAAHEKYNRLSRWLVLAYVIAGSLFPFTFFARIAAHKGQEQAMLFVTISLLVIAGLVLLAFRAGLFRDTNGAVLKDNLRLLEERLLQLERI